MDNGDSVSLPIEWLGYRQEDGKWYIVGQVDTSNLGYATLLTGKTEVKVEVTVKKVARTVTFETTQNGTADADKTEAYLGDTVTITAMPDDGYAVKSVSVNGVALTADGNGKYVYTVEGIDNVTVSVTFEAAGNGGNNGDGTATTGGCNSSGCTSSGIAGSSLLLIGMLVTGAIRMKRKKND